MKKIIAIGASNSKNSINQKLATWAASQVENVEVKVLDLNDYEMPIFGVDKEAESGVPAQAKAFKEEISLSDGIIISFAEHNGSYSAAFKNILDWVSRLEGPVWLAKPTFLLATSPGARGGMTVLGSANTYFPYMGAKVTGSFSLPSFQQNFNETGITETALKAKFEEELAKFEGALVEENIEG
ncbi:NADPH-dependent FMN reductase [Sediminitomix flava]|uniref:NAD(P)H-dependent FMN reductase n=1 Tax=Sediminitomix flava TaxID=379075 RepID=A0A315ZE31_SEDFL|nr:NAD(P)H-dependent oxidoreductase [Sediminitomix flava]PWJ43825.1 NAD(P)H-dependent FMN reductase [Sediminitomix flava]